MTLRHQYGRLGGRGENSSLHPPFRRKRGAPIPLHPPWLRAWYAQGRIQDLSEGGARFISELKSPDLGTKRRTEDEILLWLSCFALAVFFPLSAIEELFWNLRGGMRRSCRPPYIRPGYADNKIFGGDSGEPLNFFL